MLRIAFIKLFLLAFFCAKGQIEYTLSLRSFDSDGLALAFPNFESENDMPGLGAQLNVSYLFPLQQINLKAGPELGFGHYQRDYEASVKSSHSNLSFNLTAVIYPFDLSGKCNCPTFSKNGDAFTKGFFLQFSPGFWLQRNHYKLENTTQVSPGHTWLLGGGIGLELGLSEHLTISPTLSYFHGWETHEASAQGKGAQDLLFKHFGAGIRIGFP